jgi:hypothetical protein
VAEEEARVSPAPAPPLLPGETAQSDVLEDAEHWAAVYQELAAFLDGSALGRPEATERFRRRLDYWRHRQDELISGRPAR